MKSRIINSIITKKIEDWVSTIEDEQVKQLAIQNTIVTGGCIASMLLKEEVHDFDLYFRNRETTEALARYYVGKFNPKSKNGIPCKITIDTSKNDRIGVMIKSAGIASENGTVKAYEYFESQQEGEAAQYVGDIMDDPGQIEDCYCKTEEMALATTGDKKKKTKYRPVFMSTNAITLSDKVQLVLRFYGNPEEIHANYDYVHCTNYWTSWDKKVVLKQDALESLLSKELKYVGSKYPVCSVFRMRKFINRGWYINAGQILKMAMQISELDLKNVEVLRDQLTGVDCAYFCEVIEKLKEKDPDKVESAYLVEILDKMF